MELRWVIILALWSMLIGPVFDCGPGGPTARPHQSKPAKTKTHQARR